MVRIDSVIKINRWYLEIRMKYALIIDDRLCVNVISYIASKLLDETTKVTLLFIAVRIYNCCQHRASVNSLMGPEQSYKLYS